MAVSATQMRIDNVNWRNIAEAPEYQVSILGEVRKILNEGYFVLKKFTKNDSSGTHYVTLKVRGKWVARNVAKLVYEAFRGKIPKNYVTYHKNYISNDNRLVNIDICTRRELGSKTGGKSRRKSVVKIDKDGNFVEFYPSMRKCVKANYLDYKSL